MPHTHSVGHRGIVAAMTMQKALFAAGCFWGVQYYFDQVPGVVETTVGYTGGHTKNPTYEEVVAHRSGHAEAVLVRFDSDGVSYETLVRQFFHMHDPTQLNRQGPDIGDNYRTAIFYFDDDQKQIAERIKQELLQKAQALIVTEITAATAFYEAEAYHQKYAKRTGRGMCHTPYVSLK